MEKKSILLALILLFFWPFPSYSGEKMPTETGMPLPRFVSLRTDKANMRTGPGTRYPIEWVFKREGLPLEITTEYDVWRRVRDWEGAQGWIHQSTLSGHRTLVVTENLHIK